MAGVWINKEKLQGKSYKSIYIIAETVDVQARQAVENALADKAVKNGYKVTKSIDALPPNFADLKLATNDQVTESVKSAGSDAIFVVTYLKKEESIRHVAAVNAYSPMPYYGWGGNFIGYYNHWYPTVTTPGYYTKEKTYFIQSNLYDASSQELMLSIQSDIFDPASLNDFCKSYVSDVIKKMEKEGLIKK